MIDSHVELILIDGLAGEPAMIVGGPCAVGSGYRSSNVRATGSTRSAGIVLPANGLRVVPPFGPGAVVADRRWTERARRSAP